MYHSFPTLLHCLLCYLSLTASGVYCFTAFSHLPFKSFRHFKVTLQSDRAESMLVNLHSKLGEIKESELSEKEMNQIDHLCSSDNIFNRIIPEASQLGIKLRKIVVSY